LLVKGFKVILTSYLLQWLAAFNAFVPQGRLHSLAFSVGTGYRDPFSAVLAIIAEESDFPAFWAGYFQRKPAGAASLPVFLNGRLAFRASERTNRVNFPAKWTDRGIGRDYFITISARLFIARHTTTYSNNKP